MTTILTVGRTADGAALDGVLTAAGHRVVRALTAREAVARARGETPGLVLADGPFSARASANLVARLRADPVTAKTPIVLLASTQLAALGRIGLKEGDGIESVAVLLSNLTERQEAAPKPQASEASYRHLFKENPSPMWLYDRETLRFLAVNHAFIRQYGYSEAEILALTIADIRPPEDVPALARTLEKPRTDFNESGPLRHRRKDGQILMVQVTSTEVEFAGRQARLVLARDVTAEIEARSALAESEERLRLALSAANQGLYDLDVQTGEAVVSPEYATMLGYDPAEFHETNARWIERLHPDDRATVSETYRAYVAGTISEYRVEFRQRTRHGGWKWILSLGRLVEPHTEGRPLRMLGTHTDITDRKLSEARVAKLTRLYAALSQTNQAIVRTTDRDSLFSEVCRVAVAAGGLRMAWIGLVDPRSGLVSPVARHGANREYADRITVSIDPSRAEGRGPTGSALRSGRHHVCNDLLVDPPMWPWREEGRLAGFGSSGAFPLLQGGAVRGALNLYAAEAGFFDDEMVALLDDMTADLSLALERFAAEEQRALDIGALRASEERFRHLLASLDDVVWSAAVKDGEILYINDAAERVYGRPRTDFQRHPSLWLDLVHPDDVERARAESDRLFTAGRVDLEYRIVRPDGQTRWLRDRRALISDETGRPFRIGGIASDVTERKRAEARLSRLSREVLTAQENERRRIAHELHDEVGQILTTVKMDLQALQRLTGPPPDASRLSASLASVEQALQQVRALSLDLRPPLLDELGLETAVRAHVERRAREGGLTPDVSIALSPGPLSPEVEIAGYRIVQEAVTNVLRHAGAQRLWVEIRQDRDALCVVVRDDGCGFDPRSTPARTSGSPGAGLTGMHERAALWGGRLAIDSAPGAGTRVAAWLPLALPSGRSPEEERGR